ncbi:MAG TPA: ATP-binding protein, partial [Bryobacteraceae bacterium]|nr:ATP-binding protein [Bryobacteraceae bacterium]
PSGDGTIVGAAGVATNITEREQAETALRDSEERLRLAVHAADMGVWEWDAATDRSTWDAGLHRIMGVPSDEFDGRTETLARLIHPEDREKFLTSIEQAARMGELYQLDFRVVRPDGRMAWIADRGRPEFDPSGKLLRFRGVARDVTKQRELSEQLERAQKMEAIGQLAGGIAHDFNNLLMVIRGNMELVREKAAGNPGSERTISAVLQAADRAAAITRQLLAFSRRQVLQPKIVELGSIVSETAGLLRRVIGPAIQLELQMPADPLYARVDASQLDQVVVNLVINARDAMPEGGRVTLRVDRAAAESESVRRVRFPQMPEADYVRLTVSDTGTGMDAATQAHIFEPFFTTKELGKGTGLGLATVYGIVKQSDGWIWVDSEPGKGASFEVYLPEVAAPQQAEAPPRARSSELRGTETLVVVDDEEDILELATGYLSSLGYQVIAASSGDQALEKIGAHAGPIDALITDAQMPGTPGLRLAQTVRATRPDIKVLYISGYAEDSGIPGRLPRADEDFLQKPFELSELA